jgi:hypothetical protein
MVPAEDAEVEAEVEAEAPGGGSTTDLLQALTSSAAAIAARAIRPLEARRFKRNSMLLFSRLTKRYRTTPRV